MKTYNIGDKLKIVGNEAGYDPSYEGKVGTFVGYWAGFDVSQTEPLDVPFPYWVEIEGKDQRLLFGQRDVVLAAAEAPEVRPSIAKDISLYPQTKTVLKHLEKRGTISPMEALMTYGIYRLSARINELRRVGYKIKTTIKQDAAGHRYARYDFAA